MHRLFLCWLAVTSVTAQEALTLRQAVTRALDRHPALEAAGEQRQAASARTAQARSGFLPTINYTESFQRSNNPVFVFSSLLTQGQFQESNFAIGRLNRPSFINNFQSILAVEQTIWDAGATAKQVEMARLSLGMTTENERRGRLGAAARVVETYLGAKLAEARLHAATEAVKSMEADLKRAEAVRGAGMSTDADVLSIRAQLAVVQEQEIARKADVGVAAAAVNDALGNPLDTSVELSTPLAPLPVTDRSLAAYEASAVEHRPELRQARLAAQLAESQASAARSALLPQIGVRGVFEADRQNFATEGGANWFFGATLRWNLFNGNRDRARISEASHAFASAKALARSSDSGVRLELRRAWAGLNAAYERIGVASAAVDMVEESLRITKNRYEAGLTTVTELLRAETALVDARTRRLGAIYEQRLAAAALELAAGTLTPDSEVLK